MVQTGSPLVSTFFRIAGRSSFGGGPRAGAFDRSGSCAPTAATKATKMMSHEGHEDHEKFNHEAHEETPKHEKRLRDLRDTNALNIFFLTRKRVSLTSVTALLGTARPTGPFVMVWLRRWPRCALRG